MDVLLYTHEAFAGHETGPQHPERPERLAALVAGVEASQHTIHRRVPDEISLADLELVHDAAYIERIHRFCAGGGGELDVDTHAVEASWQAAILAAGSGVSAIRDLRAGDGDLAVCVVRPPGHHARREQAMGFCLFNNTAVAAARLASEGQRVAVVDWDVHHGNGTQETFFDSSEVLYLSIHQWGPHPDAPGVPFYPGTGWLDEVGSGAGRGATVNLPVPPATVGDIYSAAFDSLLVPVIEQFDPDWLLVSAGFDAHHDDPLGDVGLLAPDYAAMALALRGVAPTVLFAEGGYDLDALTSSMTATVDGFGGAERFDGPSWKSPDAAFRLVEQATIEARQSGALR